VARNPQTANLEKAMVAMAWAASRNGALRATPSQRGAGACATYRTQRRHTHIHLNISTWLVNIRLAAAAARRISAFQRSNIMRHGNGGRLAGGGGARSKTRGNRGASRRYHHRWLGRFMPRISSRQHGVCRVAQRGIISVAAMLGERRKTATGVLSGLWHAGIWRKMRSAGARG
jgi:hypothetical protein